MHNISEVERAVGSNDEIAVPHYIAVGGGNYIEIRGGIWRMYDFVQSRDVDRSEKCRLTGRSFGAFIRLTSGCRLADSGGNIHDYGRYLSRLQSYCESAGERIDTFDELGTELETIFGDGLTVRNVHGDAKSDNIVFADRCTVIDLDTVCSGYAALDYGDMIRSLCTDSSELPLAAVLTKGFAEGLHGILDSGEVRSLYYGILYVTAELAMRYLIDALSGEGYFRGKSPEDCLSRADSLMGQLSLFTSHRRELTQMIRESFGE